MYFRTRSIGRLCARPVLPSRELSLPILQQIRGMKRKAASPAPSARKSVKVDDYCSVQTNKDTDGNAIWPAPEAQMTSARMFLREWYVQESKFQTM